MILDSLVSVENLQFQVDARQTIKLWCFLDRRVVLGMLG